MQSLSPSSVSGPATRIAVLASGRGTNFDSILAAVGKGLNAEIVSVVSDRPNAPVLAKARAAGIPDYCIPFTQVRQEHEKQILRRLEPDRPSFLVLAGYMRILTPYLIDAFRCDRGYSRMVNIHPSLLPSFPGTRSYAQAFRYGVKWTGVTVHLVEPTVDAGPICAQEGFSIEDCRSEEEVEIRGLKVEHRLYPETLKWVLAEKFVLEPRSHSEAEGKVGASRGANTGGRYYVRPN